MFNNLLNKIKERKKELAEIEKKINASNVLLDQQKHLFSENVKKIIDSEKKIKELDRQIANREKFWIDTELKYIDNCNNTLSRN